VPYAVAALGGLALRGSVGSSLARALVLAVAAALAAAALAPQPARPASEVAPRLPLKPDGGDAAGSAAEPAPAASERTYPYEVTITGLAEGEANLENLLRRASQLVGLQDRPPPTEAALRRRAKDDVGRLATALRSEGFYDADVSFELTPPEQAAQPAQVTVNVDPGTVYLLSQAEIAFQGDIAPEARNIPRGPDDLGLHIGMQARAPAIQRAQQDILAALEDNGYPQAEVVDRTAVIDRERKTMRVTWQVDPGPLVRFGDMQLQGLTNVEAKYVQRFRTWQPGALYDLSAVEATRTELVETGLFEGIQTQTAQVAQNGARAPVTFTFQERAHRTIGFGARYSTSEGPAANAFWEHRNAFGANEKVRLELEVGLIEQRFSTNIRKPRFQRDDQALVNEAKILRHETDAFEELTLGNTLSLEREFSEIWTGTAGGSIEFSRLTDNEGERDFILFGLPGGLTRDTRDSLLDPTEGTRLDVSVTPYLATVDQTFPFMRTSVGGAAYYAIDADNRYVLAARGRVGSIVGAETEDIPASKRFYAGGGGSVRGFPFEEVGPLDSRNDPLGGRSLVELSLELRVKITDTIGIVPFVDAGNVYDTLIPDLTDDRPLRYGAGLGVRYYTPIGPLRFDVAVPINARETDDAFEIYISLGQSF